MEGIVVVTTGILGAQSSVRQLVLEEVTLTYVVDGAMAVDPVNFFPSIPPAYWETDSEMLDSDGWVAMSTGGLLVGRESQYILIDAGFGEVRATGAALLNCGALPKTLSSLDVRPEDIGVVAITHLHPDHTGWLFGADGAPMFPGAKYVIADREWAPYGRGVYPSGASDLQKVVMSLEAIRWEVADGQEVVPGVQAIVTPGHSPGHTSYIVTSSSGQRVVAFGDAFHHPAQIAHPDWGSAPDFDTESITVGRARVLVELERPQTVGFGMHFGDQPFGRVERDARGAPTWCPVPTAVLGPPPRRLDPMS
jgi:glyoxylase-like metal-dependent hydrolase (beta-lactamase superfamily II)